MRDGILKRVVLGALLAGIVLAAAPGAAPEVLLRLDDVGMNHAVNTAVASVAATGIPFSVSVLFALGGGDVMEAVRAAHAAAVSRALGWLEGEAAYTRRGAGGAAGAAKPWRRPRPRPPRASATPTTPSRRGRAAAAGPAGTTRRWRRAGRPRRWRSAEA